MNHEVPKYLICKKKKIIYNADHIMMNYKQSLNGIHSNISLQGRRRGEGELIQLLNNKIKKQHTHYCKTNILFFTHYDIILYYNSLYNFMWYFLIIIPSIVCWLSQLAQTPQTILL